MAYVSELLAITATKSGRETLTVRLICCIINQRLQNLKTEGAFLWDDPDGDECSKITLILCIKGIHASESYNVVQSGFKGSFDTP